MKNKTLIAFVIFSFVFFNVVNAKNEQPQAGQQTQTANQVTNQGENSQIQTNEQNKPLNTDNGNQQGNSIQSQQQTQENLQDGTGDQIQQQIQQGNQNQIKQQASQSQGLQNSEQRRSQVANAVQEMLQIAERNQGIGQQVKVVAQAQNENNEKLENSLQKIQNRNRFLKLLIGVDYEEINSAEQVLTQNQEQIMQLNQIKTQLANQADQDTLTQQIQLLEQANQQIQEALSVSQKGFSLLGWAFKLFSK
ncbi:MAG: hypothetical protein PHD93_01840 [Candidatus Pacebacteria bacterium]|jgi:hypothetical protein|nr:hypothetical protein [Candidatus Paceibacterota bacterium]